MRASAAALEPYDAQGAPVEVNLSANENTHGMPPAVRAEVARAMAQVAEYRYPAPLADDLRREIAAWHGVGDGCVIVGNGGDELLFNLFLAFGGRGHVLVSCPPTFSVYRLYAELAETEVVEVPREPRGFAPDVDALVAAARGASLVVVTSPNNPTGDLFPLAGVERLCEACPGVVVVDEAYAEFAREGSSAEPLLASHPNLAVLHTLSKAFAFAAGRLGYVLASPGVVAALAAVRQPYSVNAFSQAAALVAVRMREEFLPAVEDIRGERERLARRLAQLPGATVWPSEANFLLVRVPRAHEAWRRLRDEHSVLVRDFSGTTGLAGCLRVSVGTREEDDRLLAGLADILGDD